MEDRWLTIKEASHYLSVATSTIYGYMEQGRLPYRELSTGGGRRIRQEDLDRLLVADPPRPRQRGKKKGQPPLDREGD